MFECTQQTDAGFRCLFDSWRLGAGWWQIRQAVIVFIQILAHIDFCRQVACKLLSALYAAVYSYAAKVLRATTPLIYKLHTIQRTNGVNFEGWVYTKTLNFIHLDASESRLAQCTRKSQNNNFNDVGKIYIDLGLF